MATRKKANISKTYLCAVKFWSGNYPGAHGHGVISTHTSKQGVRHVVRKQGFSTQQIYATERALLREDLIMMDDRGGVRLSPKGARRAKCRTVKLAPWTNKEYGGSRLEGVRGRNYCVWAVPKGKGGDKKVACFNSAKAAEQHVDAVLDTGKYRMAYVEPARRKKRRS